MAFPLEAAAGGQRGASISIIDPVLPGARPTLGYGLLLSQRRQVDARTAPWLPAAAPGVYAAIVALVLVAVLVAGYFPVIISSTQPGPLLRASQISLPGTAGAAGWAQPAAPAASVRRPIEAPLINPPPLSPPSVSRAEPTPAAAQAEVTLAPGTGLARAARQEAVAVPPSEVLPAREPASRPLFFRYEVQPGDTVSGIAHRFGISSNYVRWNNGIIDDADVLRVGEQIQVPSAPGIIHLVRAGETLYEIALRYKANVADIISTNSLRADGFIRAGATIFVPGGRYGFVWPARDTITSYFGPSHPLGIDIRAEVGTPIESAGDGIVTFVGGDPGRSYGFYVRVKHGGGFTSLYGHLRNFAVKNGDRVKAGQVLGFAGLTGRTTGPHLHFEVELNGVRRNPLLYLP